MRHLTRVVFAGLLGTAALMAQPVVNSVLNPASYALPGMPNYGVAQGSLFVAFGTNLGPPGLNQVATFPLDNRFNGISMKVRVGGTDVDCLVLNSFGAGTTPATQVVGLLPSNTPVGTGTFVLTYNNQSSAPASIKVVKRAFGAVAVNAGGSGPAVVTDGNYQVRVITQSATPGQTLILWGTGLGPISADERQPAPFRDMTEADVKVYVGGRLAQVAFRGRSPGASGLDQINFVVPAGLSGCYVPLVVIVDGIASNWTTLPIAAAGGACSDPNGLSAQEISAAQARGYLRTGDITLLRSAITMNVLGFNLTTTTDTGSANFDRYDYLGLISYQGSTGSSFPGACTVYQFKGEQPSFETDPWPPVHLDAGNPLSLSGPKGAKTIPVVQGQKGVYSATLGGGGGPFGGGQPDYLDVPGTYTVTGPGGADVGQFNTSLTLPTALSWTNQTSVNSVTRSQDLALTWSGGPQNGLAMIMGYSGYSTPLQAGGIFVCMAPVSAGQFTVPAWVLSALPVSEVQSGVPIGMLLLGAWTQPVTFSATGLDRGTYSAQWVFGKMLAYQ